MQKGFSLVELSIVLVILGLLTGGILAGQSLIRAAELRAVTAEYQRYVAAAQSFRGKYIQLPGDMNNAVSFWGAADAGDGTGADCLAVASTTAATCNGNGDGSIQGSGATTYGMESYRFWQHMANAGLIEGQYSGAPTSAISANNRYARAGTNIPASKMTNAAWYIEVGGYMDGTGWAWAGDYGNLFTFGGVEATDITEVAILKPEEMWNIDVKMDDGKPAYGSIRTSRTDADCQTGTTQATASTAEYTLTSSSVACFMVFLKPF